MPSVDTGITSTVWRISGVSVRYLSFMKSIWLVIYFQFGWASLWQFWPGPWSMRSCIERQRGLDSNRGPILWKLWVMSYLCPCHFQAGRVFLLQVWRGNLATEKTFLYRNNFSMKFCVLHLCKLTGFLRGSQMAMEELQFLALCWLIFFASRRFLLG